MQIHSCFEDRETSIFDDPSMQKQLFVRSRGVWCSLNLRSFFGALCGHHPKSICSGLWRPRCTKKRPYWIFGSVFCWASLLKGPPKTPQNDKISFLAIPGQSRRMVALDAWSQEVFQTWFCHDFTWFWGRFWNPMLLLLPLLCVMSATPCWCHLQLFSCFVGVLCVQREEFN